MSLNLEDISSYDFNLLNLLTENLPDMLWMKDLDGKYIYVNKAICEGLLMAKDINEPIGKGDVFFAMRERETHEENPDWHTFGELCINSDKEVIDHNKAMKFVEYGNIKGELVYLEVNKAPFYDNNGNIIGTVGSGRDITALKLTKIKLKKQYEIMKRQAIHVSMGEMIGNIAHQWRQPLSVISTASTGMKIQKEFGKLSDEAFNKNCDVINENAQYLSNTIDDFRNFIKGDRTKKIYSLEEDIRSFLHLVEGSIKNNDIQMILDLQEDIKINGYENELTQCLINIFNNAKDVLNDKVETNRLIFISTSLQNDKAIIKIKDNAEGIPEGIINKVFEPYFTTKHKSQGTGLGLHMTYSIITDGMNGTIEVNNVEFNHNNRVYIGAEFTITLPI